MDKTASPVAFVAGSTGYVGQAVVAELRNREIATVAHIRPESRQGDDLGPRFESLGATLDRSPWQSEALAEALGNHAATHVFCLIGTTRKQAAAEGLDGNIYERIDLGLTALLTEAATASGQAPRFIYLSSIGASTKARSAYLIARGQAEARVRQSELPFFIARPSFITGSDRDESRPGERIGAAVADGALAVVGLFGGRGVQARYQSTTASMLARGLVDGALGSDTGVFEGADLRPTQK